MLDIRHPELRPYALEGNFGLEREALRVTGTGRMAQTPHPFPPDAQVVLRAAAHRHQPLQAHQRSARPHPGRPHPAIGCHLPAQPRTRTQHRRAHRFGPIRPAHPFRAGKRPGHPPLRPSACRANPPAGARARPARYARAGHAHVQHRFYAVSRQRG